MEDALQALEAGTGLMITIHDRQGIFHDVVGTPLLTRERQSHQSSPLCALGFCNRCIEHCLHAVNEQAAQSATPFRHRCWKGLEELVIPLHRHRLHAATLFAGQWRSGDSPATGLPTDLYVRHDALKPAPTEGETQGVARILKTFGHGLLLEVEERHAHRSEDTRRNQILDFVERHACQDVSLGDLAAELCLSPSRTSHLVREVTGCSFQQLVMDERMLRARNLLATTDNPVYVIAELVGMANESYFGRKFKESTGLSPGAFRKRKISLLR